VLILLREAGDVLVEVVRHDAAKDVMGECFGSDRSSRASSTILGAAAYNFLHSEMAQNYRRASSRGFPGCYAQPHRRGCIIRTAASSLLEAWGK
jgi:hypothetical protein